MIATNGLLLDTHVFLWWKLDDTRLRKAVRDNIANAELVFVSAASAWEAAIKVRLGKLDLDADFATGVTDSGFERLAIGFEHAAETKGLPLHHRNPFDRMLIAQARVEHLTLVTHDHQLEPYDVELLWT
ncbi:type II toxin-antitoxin system VapC family toxin [Candidatus Thiosymbion oneisti]|uniref:type II toxin-antitoxin system VapC family toxin n=1 Tax=Candidatus Thiosymbion oneisti TaxID=589554 RepID=UPI00210E4211|nr:type II toxin-antitoxin system VapC family toxin [Candidatus Thiosymbion oneisti]